MFQIQEQLGETQNNFWGRLIVDFTIKFWEIISYYL